MAKLTLTDITSGYGTAGTLTANNALIEAAIENTLSRDGSTPNEMAANLDMNSHRIINLDAPSASTDAARWIDVTDSVSLTGSAVPALTGNSQKFLGTDGSTLGWKNFYDQTAAESAAGVTPTYYKYPPYDLMRYGAVLDGATNDGTAVRNWLLASSQAGALATCSGAGTALCTSYTTVDTTNSVRIYAPSLTIKGPVSTTRFLSCGGGTLVIVGVTFDQWSMVVDRQSTDSGTMTRFIFENNTVTGCTAEAVNIEIPISNYTIRGNRFYSNTGGYVIRIGENTYASQDNWLKGVISGNTIKDTTASSTTSAVAIIVYGREVVITNNVIDTVTAASGEAWGIYTKVRYGVVSGNTVRNVDSTASTDIVGINIKGAGRGVTSGPQGFSMVVSSNQVYTVGTGGTDGNGIRAQTDDVLITGNIVEDAGLLSIVVDESAGSNNIEVYDNKIRSGTAASRIGVYIATSGKGIKVRANNIYNLATGVRVASAATGTLQDVEVFDNAGSGCSQALVDVNTPSTISGLKVHRNTLHDGARGFLNSGGAGTITGLEIFDNDFDAATTAAIGGTLPVSVAIRHYCTVATTDATQTAIFNVTMPDESSYSMDAQIVGRDSATTNRAAYIKHALAYRDAGGGATIQTGVTDISTIESNAAWNGTIIVSGNTFQAAVTGAAGVNVSWKALINLVGV